MQILLTSEDRNLSLPGHLRQKKLSHMTCTFLVSWVSFPRMTQTEECMTHTVLYSFTSTSNLSQSRVSSPPTCCTCCTKRCNRCIASMRCFDCWTEQSNFSRLTEPLGIGIGENQHVCWITLHRSRKELIQGVLFSSYHVLDLWFITFLFCVCRLDLYGWYCITMPATFKTDCHESFGNKCNRMASFDIFPEKHDALSLCDSDHFRINWRRVTHGTASARSRGCLQGRGTSRTGNYGGPPCTQTSKPSKPLNVVFFVRWLCCLPVYIRS